jgi:hypothetical protein
MDRDTLYEAAEQVLSHIRYTQHLAMTDNIYDDRQANWFYARWHMRFVNGACGVFYRVGSDSDLSGGGVIASSEAARDPLSRELIYNNTLTCADHAGWYNDVLIGQKYSILNVVSSCGTQTIGFDHIGRPYTNIAGVSPDDGVMTSDCHYTFTDASNNQVMITVTAETGYAYITYN